MRELAHSRSLFRFSLSAEERERVDDFWGGRRAQVTSEGGAGGGVSRPVAPIGYRGGGVVYRYSSNSLHNTSISSSSSSEGSDRSALKREERRFSRESRASVPCFLTSHSACDVWNVKKYGAALWLFNDFCRFLYIIEILQRHRQRIYKDHCTCV